MTNVPGKPPTMHLLSSLALLGFLLSLSCGASLGCGGRALGGADGVVPLGDAGILPGREAGNPNQPCKPPAGSCNSSKECPAGQTCFGCGADPCCPMCAVCLGQCVPGCQESAECPDGEYCSFASGCGGNAPGTCTPRPQGCLADCPGVCGCDGKFYCNACGAAQAGFSLDPLGSCEDPACASTTCEVLDTCCECRAAKSPAQPIACAQICEVTLCTAMGMKQPAAYCLKGKCLLEDAGASCSNDTDCTLVDDCCGCLALPKGVFWPECVADCFQSACSAMGLVQPRARCLQGRCRVSPS